MRAHLLGVPRSRASCAGSQARPAGAVVASSPSVPGAEFCARSANKALGDGGGGRGFFRAVSVQVIISKTRSRKTLLDQQIPRLGPRVPAEVTGIGALRLCAQTRSALRSHRRVFGIVVTGDEGPAQRARWTATSQVRDSFSPVSPTGFSVAGRASSAWTCSRGQQCCPCRDPARPSHSLGRPTAWRTAHGSDRRGLEAQAGPEAEEHRGHHA